jgi:hypothetical protein
MLFKHLSQWWQRLRRKIGWFKKGTPVWGDEPPTIMGVCPCCGAVILEGWHQEGPEGLICLRCANSPRKEGKA